MTYEKRGEMNSLKNLGFYQMKDVLQKKYVQQQCEELTAIFLTGVDLTEKKVHIRKEPLNFCLDRKDKGKPRGREAIFERAIWDQFKSRVFIPDICSCIRSYQVPLYNQRDREGWGAIDLLGESPEFCPVVIELKVIKKDRAPELPLRALLEAAAYGIAIRKNWESSESRLRKEWISKEPSAPECPKELEKVSLICVAPGDYWRYWLKDRYHTPEFWNTVRGIICRLKNLGLNLYFAEFEYSGSEKAPLIKKPASIINDKLWCLRQA